MPGLAATVHLFSDTIEKKRPAFGFCQGQLAPEIEVAARDEGTYL